MSNEERYIKGQEPREMSLSECVVHPESFPEVVGWIDPKDVAEFIKKLLEDLPCAKKERKCIEGNDKGSWYHCVNCRFRFKIIKEAGDELVK